MKRLYERQQRTLAQSAELQGTGFLTGQLVTIRFRPAPPSTGIVFVRTDLGKGACIPARVECVSGTQRRTTLGMPPLTVSLVEHVLAALAGLRIDNCYIDVNAPEPPGLDGSARQFVDLLLDAGTTLQDASRTVWSVTEPIVVRNRDKTLSLYPAEMSPAQAAIQGAQLRISYFLDYGSECSIHPQRHTEDVNPASFAANIAPCRTFLLEAEARAFQKQGLGASFSYADLLVFGKDGPIDNTLRFADEPARHKILDIIGDMSLLGQELCGHVIAYRSGHELNVEMARAVEQMFPQRHVCQDRLAA